MERSDQPHLPRRRRRRGRRSGPRRVRRVGEPRAVPRRSSTRSTVASDVRITLRRRQRLRRRARAARAARARARGDLLRRRGPARRAPLPRRRRGVEELAAAGMTIGCHGMRHRAWRGLDDRALREELVDAKAMLEGVVDRPVTQAACPFGSYDRRVLRRLRESGYHHVLHERPRHGPLPRLPAGPQQHRPARRARRARADRVARRELPTEPCPGARSWR